MTINTTDMTVLYVEDEAITRLLFSKLLKKYFKAVLEAKNGKAGLELFQQYNPDLIITDLSMPELDGFEMIAAIRNQFSSIPIIVTTAYKERSVDVIGANAIIFKPLNNDQILSAIHSVLHLKP